MNIKLHEGERVRIGKEYPFCVDVEVEKGDLLSIGFYHFKSQKGAAHHIQLRQKENQFSLFFFDYEQQLPVWWKDSKILWSQE